MLYILSPKIRKVEKEEGCGECSNQMRQTRQGAPLEGLQLETKGYPRQALRHHLVVLAVDGHSFAVFWISLSMDKDIQ